MSRDYSYSDAEVALGQALSDLRARAATLRGDEDIAAFQGITKRIIRAAHQVPNIPLLVVAEEHVTAEELEAKKPFLDANPDVGAADPDDDDLIFDDEDEDDEV